MELKKIYSRIKFLLWFGLGFLLVLLFPIPITYWIFTGKNLTDICTDKAEQFKV